MGLHPTMARSMAADRMRDRHRAAERHRSTVWSDRRSPEGPGRPRRRPRTVTRHTGQILIALGLRLTGEDRARLSLARRGTGHSTV